MWKSNNTFQILISIYSLYQPKEPLYQTQDLPQSFLSCTPLKGTSELLIHDYLCIKRVFLELVLALKLPGVCLFHRQSVFGSLEDLGFIHLRNT